MISSRILLGIVVTLALGLAGAGYGVRHYMKKSEALRYQVETYQTQAEALAADLSLYQTASLEHLRRVDEMRRQLAASERRFQEEVQKNEELRAYLATRVPEPVAHSLQSVYQAALAAQASAGGTAGAGGDPGPGQPGDDDERGSALADQKPLRGGRRLRGGQDVLEEVLQ